MILPFSSFSWFLWDHQFCPSIPFLTSSNWWPLSIKSYDYLSTHQTSFDLNCIALSTSNRRHLYPTKLTCQLIYPKFTFMNSLLVCTLRNLPNQSSYQSNIPLTTLGCLTCSLTHTTRVVDYSFDWWLWLIQSFYWSRKSFFDPTSLN